MRHGRHLVLAITAVLVLACLAYLWWEPASQATSTAAPARATAQKPVPVQTLTVQRGTISVQLTATGDIRAHARVDVFPQAEGHLRELQVEEGDRVQAGQVIAQMADADRQAAVARARAQVQALRAEWAEMQAGARPEEIAQAGDRVEHAQAELTSAEWMLERTRTMVERGLQSHQELEEMTRQVTQAGAAHSIAQQQLHLLRAGARAEEREALQARLQAAREALHLATIELQHAVVTAPLDGVVGRRYVDLGAYVTTGGTPIVTIVAMDTVKVRVPISERDIGTIRPGLNARLRVDAYPDEVFTGTVQRISPLIDPASRNGEVEIHMANPAHRLKPGMFARVALLVAQQHDVVVIPRDALHPDTHGPAVFVVQDGVAHLRRVKTGLQDDMRVAIVDGLAPGTDIVLAGPQALQDQTAVQVVQSKE